MSPVPKSRMARSFSHTGTPSTTRSPTSKIGDRRSRPRPATTCAAPSPNAAAAIPAAAPTTRRGRSSSPGTGAAGGRRRCWRVAMPMVRRRGRRGLDQSGPDGSPNHGHARHPRSCAIMTEMNPLRRLLAVPDVAPESERDSDERTRQDQKTMQALVDAGRGDEVAFGEFYDLTSRLVYGIVLKVVRDPAIAEETVQEIYLELWRLAPRYEQRPRLTQELDGDNRPPASRRPGPVGAVPAGAGGANDSRQKRTRPLRRGGRGGLGPARAFAGRTGDGRH